MTAKGTRDNPLELRPGETDRFYFIFGASGGFLATGDTLAGGLSISSDGVTVASAAINSTPLTLDGIEYAADTVAYADCSAIALGDMAELLCSVTTTSGRIARQSMWIKGARNYS